jgi:serine/threonine protein phosphatase PrpC
MQLDAAAVSTVDNNPDATAFAYCGAGPQGADRCQVLHSPAAAIAIIADGAGNSSAGAAAAESVLWHVAEYLNGVPISLDDTARFCELLAYIDRALSRNDTGEATGLFAAVSPLGIYGAGVGDCVAWLIDDEGYRDLTASVPRKPLLGSGYACPSAFALPPTPGTLLLATDGLWKYAPADSICAVARKSALEAAVAELLTLPMLASGGVPDDIGVILVRHRGS